jgi:CheY-like chemotaxis protein
VRVSVHDTGEGMTAEVKRRALEPFFTTKEVGRGSGLGLSQVYGFVRQSGGQIVLESEPGKGTSIHLYLPKSDETPERRTAPAPVVETTPEETVLLVEDNPDVLEITIENLKDLGFNVVTAIDGPRALSVLESGQRIDVLFTDVVMPNGMNGIELAHKARAMRPDLRVVLASGYADAMLKERGMAADFPLLTKPYRAEEFAEKLRRSK